MTKETITLDTPSNSHVTEAKSKRLSQKTTKARPGGGALPTVITTDLPAPNMQKLRIKVIGVTPLIVHRWDEQALGKIRRKQQGLPEQARAKKDPQAEYQASLYEMPEKKGTYGFKAEAFKKAAMFACSHVSGVTQKQIKGAFHVVGEFVELFDPETNKPALPKMREDPVRIGFGKVDLRYRGEFMPWGCWLNVWYNANVITAEQIINFVNTSGFCSGIGEWRASAPRNPGTFGLFRVGEFQAL